MDINSNGETHIIERAKTGDKDAFSSLVKLYEKKVFCLAMKMLNNYYDASEVTQDVFLLVYRNIKKFKGISNFYTWIYRITVNRCYKFYKKEHSKPRYEPIPARDEDSNLRHKKDVIGNIPSSGKSPLIETEEDEERALVRSAIRRLPRKFYEVIVLREIEGMNYSDIAEALSMSKGTVMSRLHRAKAKLVRNLQKVGVGK